MEENNKRSKIINYLLWYSLFPNIISLILLTGLPFVIAMFIVMITTNIINALLNIRLGFNFLHVSIFIEVILFFIFVFLVYKNINSKIFRKYNGPDNKSFLLSMGISMIFFVVIFLLLFSLDSLLLDLRVIARPELVVLISYYLSAKKYKSVVTINSQVPPQEAIS